MVVRLNVKIVVCTVSYTKGLKVTYSETIDKSQTCQKNAVDNGSKERSIGVTTSLLVKFSV